MTPLIHSRSAIANLSVDDEVFVGEIPYLVQKVARGGMGLVFLLNRDHHKAPQKLSVHGGRIALKTILPDFLDETSIAMFHRELAVWAAFRHPNVVALNEILDGGKDGWIAAMNCCKGSLRDHINRRKVVPLKEATDIIGDILDGLSYVYDRDRILHLDLKPENVLYDGDIYRAMRHKKGPESESWRFMLSDWGIASIKQEQLNKMIGLPFHNQAYLDTFNNMGTVLYMAPERFLRGYRSSLASDIFSLGMIYFEMLVGSLPFSMRVHPVEELLSTSYLDTAKSLLHSATIPKRIQILIMDCIAPQPEKRPSSYTELRENFASAYSGIGSWVLKLLK